MELNKSYILWYSRVHIKMPCPFILSPILLTAYLRLQHSVSESILSSMMHTVSLSSRLFSPSARFCFTLKEIIDHINVRAKSSACQRLLLCLKHCCRKSGGTCGPCHDMNDEEFSRAGERASQVATLSLMAFWFPVILPWYLTRAFPSMNRSPCSTYD